MLTVWVFRLPAYCPLSPAQPASATSCWAHSARSAAPATVGTNGRMHAFTLPTDQFDAPFYTVRSAPGGLWGEQFQDMRVASVALTWKAADRLRGQVGFMGGLPVPMADTPAEILGVGAGNWDANALVDRLPSFLAPETAIVFPGETVKVLGGAITMGMNIPMDEQWITGSYYPDGFDISSRMFSISLSLKVTSKDLYEKFSYDPAQGGAWTTDLLKEGGFQVTFKTAQVIEGVLPYSLDITGNGQSAASGDGNIIWTATPGRSACGQAGHDERDRNLRRQPHG